MATEGMEQELLQVVKMLEMTQKRLQALEQSNQILIKSNQQLIEWLRDTIEEFEDYKENVRYELFDERAMEDKEWYPVILSEDITIEKIINEKKSLARFGDGEFATIMGRVRHKFQTDINTSLQTHLKEVLESEEENLLIGIADNYGNLDRYNEQAKREIRRYLKREVRKEHLTLLKQDKIYYNAYVTRPYVMYVDNMTDMPKVRFENLKRIWDGRECIIVEGKLTRTGIGNDLLDNAKTVRRIIGPVENAYSAYESILQACLNQDKDKLFLLALGPTATVLAYELCRRGYQAVDIGHIDLEYEWFLRGEGRRTAVPGKYNNEVEGGEFPQAVDDEIYLSQILEVQY